MLFDFTAEERALLADVDAVIDIPKNTPQRVARKLYEQTKALVRQLRGLAPVLEARGLRLRTKKNHASVRSLIAPYPAGAPFEEIARWKRNGYSIDTCNALRLGEITRQVRQGYTGADFSMPSSGCSNTGARYQSGQSEDPQQTFRDASDLNVIYPEYAETAQDHADSDSYHRNCARQSKSMVGATRHYAAADLHATASRRYPDRTACEAAREASRKLKG